MDRELVLLVLAVGVTLPVGALLGLAFSSTRDPLGAGSDLERAAARELRLPLVPVVLGLASLLGWAIVEPENSERIPPAALLVAFPVILVWLRASGRAVRALFPREVRTAATLGIVRPSIVVNEEFARSLDAHALRAAIAHEQAHAAARDPLRLWLAQLITDFQWPLPGAAERFERWLLALELARDDEARLEVEGEDLAAAVIAAAKMERRSLFAVAGIASANVALRLRVERLLVPPSPASSIADVGRGLPRLAMLAALAASVVVGAHYGEAFVRLVFGWDG